MKKLVCLLLAISMLLSIGGAMAAPTEPNPLPLSTDGATITVVALHDTARVSDMINNRFTEWMEEQTGIHLDITPLAGDVWSEKLLLMINTGAYPQMILGGISYSNLELYGVEEGILLPINDMIDKYGYYYGIAAEKYPCIINDLTMSDGNIYGMTGTTKPFHGVEQAGKLYINVSWLDKLGLEMPTTTEEFANVLRAFKTGDPNGNGLADELPMSGSNSWNGFPHEMLMNAFCHYDNGRILMYKDGQFVPQYEQEGFKDGLKYVAELYTEGLIDPAAYTQTDAMLTGLVDSDLGLVGAMNLGHLYMSQAMGSPVNRDWEMLMPLTGPAGYQGVPNNHDLSVGDARTVFTDKLSESELELAFKWADLVYSDEGGLRAIWGVKGEEWDYVPEGEVVMNMMNEPAEFDLLNNMHALVTDKRWYIQNMGQGDFNIRFAVRDDIYSNNGSEARLGQQTAALYEYHDPYDFPVFVATGDLATERSLLETALKTSYDEWTMLFITGAKNVDTDWDAFLSDMQSLQIDEYIDMTVQAYDAYYASK